MTLAELTDKVRFVTDAEGKQAVQLDLQTWQEIVVLLQDTEAGSESQNQRALGLLQAWMSKPDDKDKAWWDELEADLQQNHLTFREVEVD